MEHLIVKVVERERERGSASPSVCHPLCRGFGSPSYSSWGGPPLWNSYARITLAVHARSCQDSIRPLALSVSLIYPASRDGKSSRKATMVHPSVALAFFQFALVRVGGRCS